MAPNNRAQDIFNVNGLVAVITGGGSGLGAYAARALDANGAKKVYIIGRRKEALEATAKTGVNGSITPIVGDVSSKESLTQIAEQIRQEQGYVNFLFANAGIMGPTIHSFGSTDDTPPTVKEYQQRLWKADADEFTNTFHVNSTGAYYTAVAFLDLLDAGNKQGNVAPDSQILITSSVAGFSRHISASVAYNLSKAATTQLAKVLSTSFAQNAFRIRVNVVVPGLYPSEMSASATQNMTKYSPNSGHEGAFAGSFVVPNSTSPAQRTGSEEEFAGTVLFLASRAGGYVNGETLVTDGGRLALAPSSY